MLPAVPHARLVTTLLALWATAVAGGAAAQDRADELAAPARRDRAEVLAAPNEPEPALREEGPAAALAVELGVRVGHGVAMEWDRVFGGQLATWLGGTLSFGGERVSGTLTYDAAIGTAAHDAFAHAVALRLGYDLAAGLGRTRVTLSAGPYLRFGRTGTSECLVRCTEEALVARAASQGALPMAVGASLALDAIQPMGAWLVGVSVEARGAAPIEERAVGALEIVLSFRLALDLARL